MKTSRLEAFSDGVLAILITIMVLEFKLPQQSGVEALVPLIPVFLSYVLSFLYIGIYWNNHHHMVHTLERVTGPILWANLHLLFWLSLVPFATAWLGRNHLEAAPVALYGVILLLAGLAYFILQTCIIRSQGTDSILRRAVGSDWKGKASLVLYSGAVVSAMVAPWLALLIYGLVALLWLVPDRRIERIFEQG